MSIAQFLVFMLYFQVASAGDYSDSIDLPEKELLTIMENDRWPKVGDYNGVVIYCRDGILIWFYTDEEGNMRPDSAVMTSLVKIPPHIAKSFRLRLLQRRCT